MTTPGSKDGREEVQARTPAAQWVTGVESQKMKGSEFRACRHVGFRQGLGSACNPPVLRHVTRVMESGPSVLYPRMELQGPALKSRNGPQPWMELLRRSSKTSHDEAGLDRGFLSVDSSTGHWSTP